MKKAHRIELRPGDSLDVKLVEPLDNGYPDEVGAIAVNWQDRDRPAGEIANKHRELQVDWRAERGKVGPVVFAHR